LSKVCINPVFYRVKRHRRLRFYPFVTWRPVAICRRTPEIRSVIRCSCMFWYWFAFQLADTVSVALNIFLIQVSAMTATRSAFSYMTPEIKLFQIFTVSRADISEQNAFPDHSAN